MYASYRNGPSRRSGAGTKDVDEYMLLSICWDYNKIWTRLFLSGHRVYGYAHSATNAPNKTRWAEIGDAEGLVAFFKLIRRVWRKKEK
jgi:hypothetical protein